MLENCHEEKLNERETFWIHFYNTIDNRFGYNANDGGDSRRPTLETIDKIRQANIGKKRTPEERERIRKMHLGRKVSEETKEKLRKANLGKKPSEETIEKRRLKLIGRVVSEETKERQRATMTGRKHSKETIEKLKARITSEETRQKQREKKLGTIPWNKGKTNPYSKETLEKMSQARKGRFTGENSWSYGKKASEETRKKQSQSRKGKQKGESNPSSILTESQAKEIIIRLHQGESQKTIAGDYPVSRSTIRNIKLGLSWAYLSKQLKEEGVI